MQDLIAKYLTKSKDGNLAFVFVYYETDEGVGESFDLGDEAANQEYLDRFESGELTNCRIEVVFKKGDEVGTEHLGACHFRSDHLREEAIQCVKDHFDF